MGIDCDIRKRLREQWAAPAFVAGSPQVQKHVVIDDLLTRMFHCTSPNPDGSFTGLDLWEIFIRPIRLHYQAQALLYICTADDQANVPTQKQATQQRRNQDADVKEYIGDWIMCDAGIRLPHHEYASEPIDLRRFVRTRRLRQQMWHYFNSKLQQLDWLNDTNGNQQFSVAFEYSAKEVHFHGRTDVLQTLGYNLDHLKQNCTRRVMHGEADLSLMYWTDVFQKQNHPIVIHTIDTDLIPIAFSYIQQSRCQNKQLYWVYDRNMTVYVDLVEMCRLGLQALQLNDLQFMVACILCGNDFVQKKQILHLFGLDCIFEVVQQHKGLLPALFRANETASLMALQALLAALYSKKLETYILPSCFKEGSPPFMPIVGGKRLMPPTPQVVKEIHKIIRWNVQYWMATPYAPFKPSM